MKQQYTTAILEMINQGLEPGEIISGFKKVLKQKGHEKLFAPVLRGVLRILESKKDQKGAIVFVSKLSDAAVYQAAIKDFLENLGAHEEPTLKEDATLIGGFVAQVGTTIYDISHKTALVKLYRTLVN